MFNIGDKVYVYENWTKGICEAEITGTKPWDDDFYEIKYHCFVDRNGHCINSFVGNSVREKEDIWTSAGAAYEAIEARKEAIVKKYLEEIKTVADLLQFPLDHCLNGEEYTNYEAKKAYVIKAKELLAIDIREE